MAQGDKLTCPTCKENLPHLIAIRELAGDVGNKTLLRLVLPPIMRIETELLQEEHNNG